MNLQGIVIDTIFNVLSEKIDPELLNKIFTKKEKDRLYKLLTNEVFYTLLKEKKLELLSGFGSVIVKDRSIKEKKVFDKQSGSMISKFIKSSKIIYKPGSLTKQFL